MLETLVGRLKWERIEDGIRVEIPEPASFEELLGIAAAAVLPFVVCDLFRGFDGPSRGWALAVVCVASLLLGALGLQGLAVRKRLVILTSGSLAVTILEPCGKLRTQLTYTVWNLRPNPYVSLMGKEHPEEMRVEIDSTSGTWAIASRLTEGEAAALIAKMMEVYPFPDWMPAYKAAVSEGSGTVRG